MRRVSISTFFPGLLPGLFGLLAVLPAKGGDHFLVLAGGQSAANNQVSLEKNVLFFRKVLQETAPGASLTEYFSNGNEDIRAVQFEPPGAEVPPANEYMARLFASTDYLKLKYRRHQLGEVAGITSPANLKRWFDENGKNFQSGDRLVIYVTAHGGRSRDKQKPDNTTIHLWNRQSIDVRGLQGNLKKLPKDVTIILVMAQCFSGGFAYAIFNDTEPDAGDFDRPLCGFFATVTSREAAGCTPDINEEAYDEFSSHFWAAMRGEDRLGNPIGSADYDANGQISFEEAYAYTVLASRNIDIPMKTSGAFLRARSQFRDDEGVSNDQLLKRQTPYSRVLKLAEPVERKLLEDLSARLELEGDESRYAAAETRAGEIEAKRAALKRQYDEKKRIWEGHRDAIRSTLYGRWPELSNLLTEEAIGLVTTASEEFVQAVEGHPRFESWNEVRKEREAIDEERFALEKEWVQYIRFMRAHNNVVLTENLRILADPDDLSRFENIRKAERGGMSRSVTVSE
ncbi:MAG: hypothetical protein P1U87_04735 [Verrucomicrobiales bacterium]|nr:hypothetical protein [Verrucomicrobiales bacterium]